MLVDSIVLRVQYTFIGYFASTRHWHIARLIELYEIRAGITKVSLTINNNRQKLSQVKPG